MLKALSSAATGMIAQQTNLDVIANNIANVNTLGYKKVRAEFQDLITQVDKMPGAQTGQGTYQPVGLEIGLGVRTSATTRIFTEGVLQATGRPLDVAIEGDGFFQVTMDDGSVAYTRDGGLKMDANGQVLTTDGYQLQPPIQIPPNQTAITITPDGNVFVQVAGQTDQTPVGTIQLVRFQNNSGLISIGHNLYRETPASGIPVPGTPGQEGYGSILQGFVEGSNVQTVEELINLIKAERAFESNSKIVTAASGILEQTNRMV
ncbi:flagellar basal-body rod protein FlgG [Candidatus Gastranaerophilus sp. (ex Termes propinquus)]|nr:flagellar basal-body rod protein FlgG [Candidatus Gastranaerophilus sp. (ex Termes propinquus)]